MYAGLTILRDTGSLSPPPTRTRLSTRVWLAGSASSSCTGRRGLMSVSKTRPLLAALARGLVWAISDSGGCDANIAHAALVVEEK